MPHITTGNTPATLNPRPLGKPQTTLQNLTFSLNAIKQLEGLYCLNDLHRLSGGNDNDKPHRFLKLEKTQRLIKALEQFEHEQVALGKKTYCEQVFRVANGGEYHGSYGSKKLVYAYANWIDEYFYTTVLEVFDRVFTAPLSLADKFNQKTADLKAVIDYLHECGSGLATHGKKTKPRLMRELHELLNHIQPQLPLEGVAI